MAENLDQILKELGLLEEEGDPPPALPPPPPPAAAPITENEEAMDDLRLIYDLGFGQDDLPLIDEDLGYMTCPRGIRQGKVCGGSLKYCIFDHQAHGGEQAYRPDLVNMYFHKERDGQGKDQWAAMEAAPRHIGARCNKCTKKFFWCFKCSDCGQEDPTHETKPKKADAKDTLKRTKMKKKKSRANKDSRARFRVRDGNQGLIRHNRAMHALPDPDAMGDVPNPDGHVTNRR
jgi:hypothetical protein